MEIFVTVVETGQFSRAATRLGLTKSAISHAITSLESYMGLKLLQRNSRNVTLTRGAQSFYENCKRILNDVNELEDVTRQSPLSMSGRINIATTTTYGLTYVLPIIKEFTRTYPNIDLGLNLTEVVVDLAEAQIDLAIRLAPANRLPAHTLYLRDHEVALYASIGFIAEHGPIKTVEHLKTLRGFTYVNTPVWPLQSHTKGVINFEPESFIKTDSSRAICELTAQGLGVAYMPEYVASPGVSDGRIVRIDLEGFRPLALKSFILFPDTNPQPLRVKKFTGMLLEHMRASTS